MFASIRDFFLRLFGQETEEITTTPSSRGFEPSANDTPMEDAGDLPENFTETEIPVEDFGANARRMGSPGAGSRGLGDSRGDMTDDFFDATTMDLRYLWCLDNGHGSLQDGKRSPVWADGEQLLEWQFARKIVKQIASRLDDMGIQYFIVVPEDEVGSFLPERVQRANEKISDLGLKKIFVSIHGNAFSKASAKGVETWYHLNSSSGVRLASTFQKHLMRQFGTDDAHDWLDRGIRTYSPAGKNFYVLRQTNMPAVLTENGFYTNEPECRRMLEGEIVNKIAEAHVLAIIEIEKNGYENAAIYPKNKKISV